MHAFKECLRFFFFLFAFSVFEVGVHVVMNLCDDGKRWDDVDMYEICKK